MPLEGKLSREVAHVCGSQSGRIVNKVEAAHLTLVEPEENHTPGIKEAPLTLECKVLYQQDQVLADFPEEVKQRYYSGDMAGEDFHTAYIGQIVNAYIIREE